MAIMPKISSKKTKLESKSKNLDLKRSKIGLEEAEPPPKVLELSPMGVGMSDCVQGFEPCKCKGKGYQWVGNQVFR